ncbi:MAG TPA: hypothetical protein VM370_05035, partial [Candidatus Thermoplasmatota archaeon]|nr:hypothetical protein [Candidatus Thermoplasmatota archaeon]
MRPLRTVWLVTALLLVLPLAAGAPLVPEILGGNGTAVHFQVLGTGHSVEGGAFEWTDGCTHCVIRITIRDGTFLVNDANDF